MNGAAGTKKKMKYDEKKQIKKYMANFLTDLSMSVHQSVSGVYSDVAW